MSEKKQNVMPIPTKVKVFIIESKVIERWRVRRTL